MKKQSPFLYFYCSDCSARAATAQARCGCGGFWLAKLKPIDGLNLAKQPNLANGALIGYRCFCGALYSRAAVRGLAHCQRCELNLNPAEMGFIYEGRGLTMAAIKELSILDLGEAEEDGAEVQPSGIMAFEQEEAAGLCGALGGLNPAEEAARAAAEEAERIAEKGKVRVVCLHCGEVLTGKNVKFWETEAKTIWVETHCQPAKGYSPAYEGKVEHLISPPFMMKTEGITSKHYFGLRSAIWDSVRKAARFCQWSDAQLDAANKLIVDRMLFLSALPRGADYWKASALVVIDLSQRLAWLVDNKQTTPSDIKRYFNGARSEMKAAGFYNEN
jgi:hypothetical protein